MLNLPNDIFAAVLARATPDDVCTYSHTCSAAAAAVRENRAGIVACRAPDFHGRERTLVALREFFPPGLHPDPEEALDVWPSIVEAQGSNVEEARFDFPSRGCSRVKLSSWPIRQTLDSIIVPAMNDAVALVRVEIGGQTIGTLTGAVIRALANGAPEVDIVDVTVGRGYPLGLIKYHDVVLVVELNAPCNGVRASFSVGPLAPPWTANQQINRTINKHSSIVTCDKSEPIQLDFYSYMSPFWRSYELFVLIERSDTGAIVDDVLDTLCVRYYDINNISNERTFPATALRGRLHPGARIRAGYVVPIENAFNFSTCNLSFRLSLRAGVDPFRYRVTFAHAQANAIRVMGFMAGLRFSH